MNTDSDNPRPWKKDVTKGEWSYDTGLPFNIYSDDATGSIIGTTSGFKFAPRPEAEKEANARLAVEAGTVLHQTGMTPGELAELSQELVKVSQGLLEKLFSLALTYNDRSCDYDVCPEVRAFHDACVKVRS